MARHDKTRYSEEKQRYSVNAKGGSSLVKKLRAKKDPRAPKRPMSAFLMYAQRQRKILQAENPDMPNADISRLLGETWRNLRCVLTRQHISIFYVELQAKSHSFLLAFSEEEKLPHLQREQAEREVYRAKMDKWKNDQKHLNSLKTPYERKASHHANDADEREDIESGAARKYGKFDNRHFITQNCAINSLVKLFHCCFRVK